MFSTEDTIVAIATPPGRGGIGVVRLSGGDAHAIARRLLVRAVALEPRRATLGRVFATATHSASTVIDQVIATYFPAPHSYTGDDVVELSGHGSPIVLRTIVQSAIAAGARLAEPGEFTLRAFINGRMDLPQAEAVADLIDAVTPLQARAAFDQLEGTLTRAIAEIDRRLFDLVARLEASIDFPDEGYHFIERSQAAGAIDDIRHRLGGLLADARRGRLVREGLQIAIVGRPNVGKSSLFNALVGTSRAIVTEVPGTTRDLITEVIDLDGLRVTLVDTAGLRDTPDRIEAEGVARSRQAIDVADLVLQVLDDDEPQHVENKSLIVQNKCDLGRPSCGIAVSATTGEGIDALKTAIVSALDVDLQRDRPEITNVRHIALLERADGALVRARMAAGCGVVAEGVAAGLPPVDQTESLPEEFVLADLQDARAALEEVTGRRTPDDVLAHIFSRFCIGK